jgi:hypothetical protein
MGGGGERGGELEAVDVEAGLPCVDTAGAERGENLRDGHLDHAGVFNRGQKEWLAVVAPAVLLVVTELVVEVAVELDAECWAFALGSAWQDVATFDEHGIFSLTPPRVFWWELLISFNLRKGYPGKSFLGKELDWPLRLRAGQAVSRQPFGRTRTEALEPVPGAADFLICSRYRNWGINTQSRVALLKRREMRQQVLRLRSAMAVVDLDSCFPTQAELGWGIHGRVVDGAVKGLTFVYTSPTIHIYGGIGDAWDFDVDSAGYEAGR